VYKTSGALKITGLYSVIYQVPSSCGYEGAMKFTL
jgi:hypothetical protein